MRSPIGTPYNRGVGDVLAKKGSQVGAIVFKFGLHLDWVQLVPASEACGEQMDTSSAV